jgi:hypothetical protein
MAGITEARKASLIVAESVEDEKEHANSDTSKN